MLALVAVARKRRQTEQSTRRREPVEATIQAMVGARAKGRTSTGRATRTRILTQPKHTIRTGMQEGDEVGRVQAALTRATSNTGRSRKERRKKATTRTPRRTSSSSIPAAATARNISNNMRAWASTRSHRATTSITSVEASTRRTTRINIHNRRPQRLVELQMLAAVACTTTMASSTAPIRLQLRRVGWRWARAARNSCRLRVRRARADSSTRTARFLISLAMLKKIWHSKSSTLRSPLAWRSSTEYFSRRSSSKSSTPRASQSLS